MKNYYKKINNYNKKINNYNKNNKKLLKQINRYYN